MRLLVTRPQPDCECTARALRARGHEVLVVPLLRIDTLADADLGPGPWAASIFTSANAVRALAAHRRFDELAGLCAYAVGKSTRAAAVAAGFTDVRSADGDVAALARFIAAQPPTSLPLLYLAGRERAGDLAGDLQVHGLHVETVPIYQAVTVTDLPQEVRAAFRDRKIDAVLHYSARTAGAFVAAAAAAGISDVAMEAKHFCLSIGVAAPLAAAGARALKVAALPNEHALFECIETD